MSLFRGIVVSVVIAGFLLLATLFLVFLVNTFGDVVWWLMMAGTAGAFARLTYLIRS